MTILYKIFGIPRTIDEVADKATKKGLTPDIFVEKSRDNNLATDSAIFEYHIGIKIGHTSLTIGKWTSRFNYSTLEENMSALEQEDNRASGIVQNTAKELFSRGIQQFYLDGILISCSNQENDEIN